MFLTVLTIFQSIFNFFSIKSQKKGQIYTIIAFIADFYVLYISYELIKNHAARGWWILLAFFILMYFTILNFIYYFTDKSVKWDISSYVDYWLGGESDDENSPVDYVPSNGVYNQKETLPVSVTSDSEELKNLNNLMDDLQKNNLLPLPYNGLNDLLQKKAMREEGIIYKYRKIVVPYYSLEKDNGNYTVIGGVNKFSASNIGKISKIGIFNATEIPDNYELSIASLTINGGENKKLDSNKKVEVNEKPYILNLNLAYQKKND